MITLNFGTKTYPLTREEAAFVAESLTAAVSGKPATAPAFTSGMHGHISVLSQKAKPAKQIEKKEDGEFRSNPPQSDHVLTDC
ncbi:hypothetical protein CLM65_21510 [Serratia marcescens]|uniref:hypothetical protein n=1 Tax=Serratia TaxID=613 RepID=UPI000A17028E|nr:hypothetical protein [Serratia marcescens]AWC74837.1 hypothetical protein AM371_07775 [Serratia marcescens]EIJ6703459.1 hypothetical protein [Serratia marcescens]EIV5187920.1 hypothetical protein [Serratia marcescens]ELQ6278845.1 hypothetical protein [Serratia marcescens]EMF1927189.1 hypothetical protein [Serratia marcescens]